MTTGLREVDDLYNYSPCGYHSVTADNTILRINETELNWLGYTREELIGKKYNELISRDTLESWVTACASFWTQGQISNVEFELLRKDGSTFPVMLNSVVIFDSQRNVHVSHSVVFDLTIQKNTDLKLKEANDKLTKINAEKNNFLSIASHDLKSPLNAMLALINILKHDTSNFTKDQSDNLNLVYDSARNMKMMIDRLLDLARIEQGKSMLQLDSFNVVPVIEAILTNARINAGRKNIQVDLKTISSEIIIYSDDQIISQIIENLLSNAIKFSPPDKKVWVRLELKDKRLIVHVCDEGPGIKPEEAHKVFGKFQKLSARPTGGETSTGLGLSIVKELVSALDGNVTFTQGPGAVFTLDLPVK